MMTRVEFSVSGASMEEIDEAVDAQLSTLLQGQYTYTPGDIQVTVEKSERPDTWVGRVTVNVRKKT